MRRYSQDQNKMGMGRGADVDTHRWDAGAESERRKATPRLNKILVGIGGTHALRQPSMAMNSLTHQKEKAGDGVKVSNNLHEKGRGDKMVEKKEEKRLVLTGETLNQAKS